MQIYFRKNENYTNYCSNILEAQAETLIQIYYRPKVKKNSSKDYVLEKLNKLKMLNKKKYLRLHFDLKASIQIYLNINNVII